MNSEPAPPLEVSFESGGETCRAWHFLPESDVMAAYGRSPCVVMGHGFGATRDAGLAPYAQRFAAEGFHVVIFDYRNFGASGGEPRQLISIKLQLEDWLEAASFAREISGVDPSRVAIWGTSFAGGLVIDTASKDQRIAAVIAQCPALDGRSLSAAYLRYAGIISGLKLLWAGMTDGIGARLARAARMLPIVGPPGSLAFLSAEGAESGYRAIAPASWRNETPARIVLALPFYRPLKNIPALSCPLLLQFCGNDVLAPPHEPAMIRTKTKRFRLVVKNYDCGHFDIYLGEWFEKSVTDQIAFLKAGFAPK